jgi:hypothetical protein
MGARSHVWEQRGRKKNMKHFGHNKTEDNSDTNENVTENSVVSWNSLQNIAQFQFTIVTNTAVIHFIFRSEAV